MRSSDLLALSLLLVFAACPAGDDPAVDAGPLVAVDASTALDAGLLDDAGVVDSDAGLGDTGPLIDAGPERCGDGRVRSSGHPTDLDFEECDDANAVEDDGCTSICRHSIRRIATMNYSTCVLLGNGKVFCRGYNADRSLGLGEAARTRYVDGWRRPRGLNDDVIDLDGGRDWVCALHQAGEVSCWGFGSFGRGPGSATMETPTRIPGVTGAVSLAVGTHAACFINGDQHAHCWGRNRWGELGDGSTDESAAPVRVQGLEQVVDLDIEGAHACAALGSGQVWCWGNANNWRFGTNQVTGSQPVPVQVLDIESAVDVDVAAYGGCAVLADGTVSCWGTNWSGQSGFPVRAPHAPIPLPELSSARALAMENSTGCLIAGEDAQVYCFGWNHLGQAGDPSTHRVDNGLRAVEGVTGAVGVMVGAHHGCAWRADGRRFCWGANNFGQLGGDRAADLPIRTPRRVEDLEQVIQLSAGDGHICALDQQGLAKCWGSNGYGQLGDGTTQTAASPQPVTLLNQLAQIGAGESFSCAVAVDGTAYCWGYNRNGQLGLGTSVDQTEPQALDLPPMQLIRGGNAYACGLDRSGGVYCWGYGSEGVLGQGNRNSSTRPVLVASLPAVQDLSLGHRHVCAVTGTGNLFCWGRNNEGQIAVDRATSRVTSPTQVMIPSVLSVAVGRQHTCALTAADGLWCWGLNSSGQLGDGSGSTRAQPERMGALLNISSVSAWRFGYGTCATSGRQDGTQGNYCWGHGFWGQLGNGRLDGQRLPVALDPQDVLGDRVQMTVGNERQNCALGQNGRVACWGDPSLGRTGHGLTATTHNGPAEMIGLSR